MLQVKTTHASTNTNTENNLNNLKTQKKRFQGHKTETDVGGVGYALVLHLYTSDAWKKGGFAWSVLMSGK